MVLERSLRYAADEIGRDALMLRDRERVEPQGREENGGVRDPLIPRSTWRQVELREREESDGSKAREDAREDARGDARPQEGARGLPSNGGPKGGVRVDDRPRSNGGWILAMLLMLWRLFSPCILESCRGVSGW